jgi:NTP pyrophosphatase (non-canonical NTP hydrolase)
MLSLLFTSASVKGVLPMNGTIRSEIRDLETAQAAVQKFCEERDWDQFHQAKDLAIGLITESSELLEHFRFKSEAECDAIFKDAAAKEQVEDEMADVFFFLLRLAQRNQIDLLKALARKMEKSATKYPIEKARGSNKKYDQL